MNISTRMGPGLYQVVVSLFRDKGDFLSAESSKPVPFSPLIRMKVTLAAERINFIGFNLTI